MGVSISFGVDRKKKKDDIKTSIEELPMDCVGNITNYFEKSRDFFSLQLSSKFFNQCFLDKEFFGCEHIVFSIKKFQETEVLKLIPATEIELPFVRRFNIMPKKTCNVRLKPIIEDLSAYLRRFKLFFAWSKKFIHLKDLRIFFLDRLTKWKIFYDIGNEENNILPLEVAQRIQKLDLSIFKKEKPIDFRVFKSFSKIEELKINRSRFDMQKFKIDDFVCLNRLVLVVEKDVPDSFFNQIGKIENLHSLALIGKFRIKSTQHSINLSKLKNISDLKIEDYSRFKLFPKFFKGMHKLKRLTISYCSRYSKYFRESFQEITKLEYFGIHQSEKLPLSLISFFIENISIDYLSLRPKKELPLVIAKQEEFVNFCNLKQHTRIELCCSRYFFPRDFFLKTIQPNFEKESSYVFCKNCKDCKAKISLVETISWTFI